MELAPGRSMFRCLLAGLLQLGLAAAARAQAPPELPIHALQGAGHRSPLEGSVVQTTGIVTTVRRNGFFMQDPDGDGDAATSDGIFVFTGGEPAVGVGDGLRVTGEVSEFSAGGVSEGNLSVTEFAFPTLERISTGNALPAPAVLGAAGRAPPTEVIDDDGLSSFDPDEDGIDFYESLEGMRVRVDGAHAVAPANAFGEIFAVPDHGVGATGLNPRGGINVGPGDFNPERIQIDARVAPRVQTGDALGDVTGVMGYAFGAYEVLTEQRIAVAGGGLAPERTDLVGDARHLTISSYNLRNLSPADGWSRFLGLGSQIVDRLRAPDILALQEVQDSTGPNDDGVTDAGLTYRTLIDAIAASGGPSYEFADLPPADGRDGGRPGANIRVGYLYDPSRVEIVAGSKRRLADTDDEDAFAGSRKPLLASFRFDGDEVTLINNHLTSKSGSTPLFGAIQPPVDGNLERRERQARFLNDYVDGLLAADPDANVIVLGDLNSLPFELPLSTLEGDPDDPVLFDLTTSRVPAEERYSFSFEGNSQLLDYILVSPNLLARSAPELDIVHLNSEFAARLSDHDPLVARFMLRVPEPPGLALAALGLLGLLLVGARRRRGPARRA
jgi:predicted extracellular nuclease